MEEYKASERRVCGLMQVSRSSCRYRSRRSDSVLRERLQQLGREHPRFGYRRLHVLLRRDAVVVNHKRVQRVYREMRLSVIRNRRKRLTRTLQPRPVLTAPAQQWSIDFASDVTAAQRRIRVLSVVDSFTRQCHALEVDTSFPSRRVTHVLAWAIDRKIDLLHIRPGKLTENAFVGSFHGRLRDGCLNTSWFWNLFDA